MTSFCLRISFGDIFVVAFVGFGSRGDDRFRERIILFETFGERDAAQLAFAGLILSPGMADEHRPHHDLDLDRFGPDTDGDIRIGHRLQASSARCQPFL